MATTEEFWSRAIHLGQRGWESKPHWLYAFVGVAWAVAGGLYATSQDPASQRIGSVLLAILSAVATGSVIGFLFGIPRVLTSSADGAALQSSSEKATYRGGFQHNTNLEQISDWLTKIIVGVSLVKAEEIGAQVQQLAKSLARAWGQPGADVAAVFLLVASALIGFFAAYIWTRTDFAKELEQNQSDIDKIVAERSRRIEAKAVSKTLEFTGIGSVPEQSITANGAESVDFTLDRKARFAQMSAEFREKWDSDPNKGAFGKSPTVGNLTLSASVSPLSDDTSLFGVTLTVTDSDGALTDMVRFHLHPTFEPETVDITPTNGVAELKIVAVEAFTVGAEVAGTRLELDLDTLPGVPEAFRS